MIVEHVLTRQPTQNEATFGEWFIEGVFECYTLEDAIREVPGEPVSSWKVPKATAIPAGRYRLTLERSQRFGPDTITVNAVEGFTGVRVHGGNDVDDTEGCPLVGDRINTVALTISGGKARGVLDRLKARIKSDALRGYESWLTVENP